ncbi:hypothetical protein G5V58_07710 [Nocardioides anomalus]|uniref:Uncharacterized protein n=1 Tax=Nocardioides anomalus TaxID=2712223 RepID=A0A6G6WBR5_9ACTN|nr:hypothetical protein [Nocardioides anomalus]QIG42682.1 hypothetical protein G5V58_07710 [Nocardioides anomalus]
MTKAETDEKRRRLVHVRYAVAAVGEAEHSLHEAVGRARSEGASWAEVADAVGDSPEAAEQRFRDAEHHEESSRRTRST